MKKVLVIGAGGQQGREYIALLENRVIFAGFLDIASDNLPTLAYPVQNFLSLDHAIAVCDFDVALLCIPHHLHFEFTRKLLMSGKHVIKEKPFAMTSLEAQELASLSRRQNKHLHTIVQRKFSQSVQEAMKYLPSLGIVFQYSYSYFMNFSKQTSGWRALPEVCVGGVLLDMGYHAIDLINLLFPFPVLKGCVTSYCYSMMKAATLEDSAQLIFYHDMEFPVGGILSLSRHHFKKEETFDIIGSKGAMVIEPRRLTVHLREQNQTIVIESKRTKEEERRDMLLTYLSKLDDRNFLESELHHHLKNVEVIDTAYRSRNDDLSSSSFYDTSLNLNKEFTLHHQTV